MKIIKLFKRLKNKITQIKNPIVWAKKIGVNFPEGELH